MTEAEQAYMNAAKALNKAAYAAIRSCKDTTALPNINRRMLREIATMTDKIVDAGTETA